MVSDLSWRFQYHPAATEDVALAHSRVRQKCFDVALFAEAVIPDSRERSLGITKLEEAMFWLNAAIARKDANMNNKVPTKSLQGSCAPAYEQPVKVQASMPGDTGNGVYGHETRLNITEETGGTRGDAAWVRTPRH
ncbi:hypothetical protein ABZ470_23720 [Streptosporangium sp. NPDC020072]|uniref:Acb2/Tad1 domain-containing protein n=1 Tax=Streptosporangium sp. NPDC020072 TaxID=3154788 RepID=UPI00342ACB3D